MLWRSATSIWPLHSFQSPRSPTKFLDNVWRHGNSKTVRRRSQSTLPWQDRQPVTVSKPQSLNTARDEINPLLNQDPPEIEEPFPASTQRYRQVTLLKDEGGSPNERPHGPIVIDGLVRSIRKQKRVAFAGVADGSTLAPVQAVFNDLRLTEKYFILYNLRRRTSWLILPQESPMEPLYHFRASGSRLAEANKATNSRSRKFSWLVKATRW